MNLGITLKMFGKGLEFCIGSKTAKRILIGIPDITVYLIGFPIITAGITVKIAI